MAVIQDININVHGQPSEKRLQTFLRLSQNENGRMINFRVLGPPLPSNCTATFSGTKPDGNVYSKTGTVTGNFVVIEEDIQMTAVAGVWDAKLDIINGAHNIMTALIRVVVDADVVDPDAIASDSQLDGYVAQCKSYAEQARMEAYGSPLTAETKAQMTDHARVYVYTGSEPNMITGNWYYWNGSAWTSGGVYNAVAVQTDKTLTVQDKAADGKAAGDALDALKEDLNSALNIGETYSLTWEQGGLNNSGNTSSTNYNTRVRSASYVDIVDDSIAIVVPQGYKLLIHVYDRTNGTSHLGYLPSADDITDNAEFTISTYYPNATHLKFVLGKVDNSNVSPTIAELYKFTTKLNNITHLTEEINNTKIDVARNAANIPVSAFLSAINRMCVCGASWDSGYVYTEQGSTVERSYIAWGYQLSKKYNFTFVCSARHSLYTKTWLTSPYGIAYVNEHDPCDLYVLTFGGNDSKQGTEYLGALEDITSHESYDDYADSFYGNYGRIVEQIQEHAPNALIVCGMYNDGTTARNQYYTALQNICEHYHIPVFNWYEDEWYRTYLQDNLIGSHPTATLHSGIALAFERIYNNLVVDNYDYFKFLGTKGDGAENVTPSGGSIQIDSAISGTSQNPVQNKVIKTALDAKADANAVVTSVNGSIGAVVIGTATTQANGLMSSTDKGRLDTLYADYSSALTALGVS